MNDTAPFRALNASTLCLLLALGCAALLLPPLLHDTWSAPWRPALTGLTLGIALTLHWVFLAQAARRMGRSAGAWVGLSLLLFPVGSAAALMLLNVFHSAGHVAHPRRHAHG